MSRLTQERGAPPAQAPSAPAHLVFVKDVENKRGEFGGVSKREELLVDLLEARCIELPAGAVLDEAFVPEAAEQAREGKRVAPVTHLPGTPATCPEGCGSLSKETVTRGALHPDLDVTGMGSSRLCLLLAV